MIVRTTGGEGKVNLMGTVVVNMATNCLSVVAVTRGTVMVATPSMAAWGWGEGLAVVNAQKVTTVSAQMMMVTMVGVAVGGGVTTTPLTTPLREGGAIREQWRAVVEEGMRIIVEHLDTSGMKRLISGTDKVKAICCFVVCLLFSRLMLLVLLFLFLLLFVD